MSRAIVVLAIILMAAGVAWYWHGEEKEETGNQQLLARYERGQVSAESVSGVFASQPPLYTVPLLLDHMAVNSLTDSAAFPVLWNLCPDALPLLTSSSKPMDLDNLLEDSLLLHLRQDSVALTQGMKVQRPGGVVCPR